MVCAARARTLAPIQIGRFLLMEPIEVGAMAEIYAAYDEQLDRKVALKLVTGGSEITAEADGRLLREAQALAHVSHPNVVQIYEAGTYNGRLFIAMELVRGKTLSRWLEDAAQLPRAVRQREILRRFIAAGRGLEAAHAAGLAHRDFTPDNVLVSDDGRVRVVNVGVAHLPGGEPAQACDAATDRWSDQFRFCAALYHALCDALLFSGQRVPRRSASVEVGAAELVRGVPMASFVRKALHRGLSLAPPERFASMAELLAALEPRRRRLRGRIAVAAVLIVAALGGLVVVRSRAADPCAAAGSAIDVAWSAERQAAVNAAFGQSDLSFAASAWHGVKSGIDSYAIRWHGEAIAACRATYVAGTQSGEQLDRRMLCLERGRRQLMTLVTELGTGAPNVVERAVEATGALPDLDACGHAENLLFGLASPPAPVAAGVARVRDRLARALTLERLGRYEDALTIAREASATAARLGYPPVHAEALAQTARALDARSTADARAEAQRLYFEALHIAEAERHDQLAVEIWGKLVMLAVRMDSGMAQAHQWWGQAYAWSRRNAPVSPIGEPAGGQAELHHMLGEIYYRESEYAKAADEERRAISAISALPARQLPLIRYTDALAKSLEYLDDVDEARQLHERALAIATEILGAGHPTVIKLKINYGKALEKCGQIDRARTVLEDALARMPAHYRDAHPDAARIESFLSDLDYRAGQLDRAAEHARESLAIYQRTQSPDHVRLAEAQTNLANVELKRRRFAGALALYQDALALRHRHLGEDHYQIGVNEGSIAEALVELERYDEAVGHLVTAERIFQRGSGHERGTQAWMLTVRGEILAGQGRFGAAIAVLEQALGVFGDGAADPTNHALAMWTLARALRALGREEDRVHSLAERAHAMFAAQGPVDAHDREAVARFLDRLAPQAPWGPRIAGGPKRPEPRR
ncbi:MAG TPA: tetratricopeptide repeat protein [Kofleriaceae bacterium]|nr:tetratricopeptide repeat protein [Kofleriaceae bacterium]